MNKLLRTIPVFLLAFVLALAVACGGDNGSAVSDGDDGGSSGGVTSNEDGGSSGGLTSNQPNGGSLSDVVVSNATDVLGASVKQFEQNVESMRAEFLMNIDMADFAMGVDGEFAFESPDKVYMTIDIDTGDASIIDFSELGSLEVLALGTDIYFNMPFLGGWFVMSADELGAEIETFESIFDTHSPLDYELFMGGVGDEVEDLGEESIDGGTFRHYRVTVDTGNAMDAVAQAFGESDTFGFGDIPVDVFTEPMVMDLWVDTDTFLPHRIEANLALDFEGESAAFEMVFKFFDYNQDVSMPSPPTDAKSFAELFEGLFDEELSFDFGSE